MLIYLWNTKELQMSLFFMENIGKNKHRSILSPISGLEDKTTAITFGYSALIFINPIYFSLS
jgi:hypothetical protein